MGPKGLLGTTVSGRLILQRIKPESVLRERLVLGNISSLGKLDFPRLSWPWRVLSFDSKPITSCKVKAGVLLPLPHSQAISCSTECLVRRSGFLSANPSGLLTPDTSSQRGVLGTITELLFGVSIISNLSADTYLYKDIIYKYKITYICTCIYSCTYMCVYIYLNVIFTK